MFIKISSININNNPDKSLVQTKNIENNCDEKLKFGHLFVLLEINNPSQHSSKISEIIINSLNESYYLNDKMVLSEQLTSLKIESFFEAALVKTGKKLLDYIDKEKIAFNLHDLNISVGLIYEGEIYLSNSGKNKAFLIRKVNQSYEVSDIDPEEKDEINYQENKVFSSIISGEIPNNSYIIISNPSLSEYLLNKEFIEIIDKLNLEGAKEQIKNTLAKINSYSNFSGLIIKNCLLEEKMKNACTIEIKKDFRPENNHLYQAENKTEKLLNDTGSIDRQKISTSVKKILNKINIFSLIINIFKSKRKNKEKNKINDLPENITHIGNKKNKTKTILLPLIFILILALGINLYLKKDGSKKQNEEEFVTNLEQSLNQKQKQIEAFLLYNPDEAIEIIESLRSEISSLSDKEKNKVSNLKEIEEKLQVYTDQIRKMTKIENLIELANLSVLDNQSVSSALSLSGKNIYVADSQNGKIYLINSEDGLSSVLEQSDLIKSEKILSTKDLEKNSFFLNDKQIIKISSDKKVSYNKLLSENFSDISSFAFYSKWPYLLDSNKNQVLRYELINGEYSKPSNRIGENKENLNSIVIIDPNIYALKNDGKIDKYYNGVKDEKFNIAEIQPQIEMPKNFKLGKRYIYILETNEQRIIIFDRNNGSFIKQYYSPTLKNIKDIDISEEENTLYILNENIVYKANIDI